jgi:hypothetical protein
MSVYIEIGPRLYDTLGVCIVAVSVLLILYRAASLWQARRK